MFPDPDIDMTGAQDEEMELSIGNGHVLHTGGAEGTDQVADEMTKHFGIQVEVIVPPNHPRAGYISPATVEVLLLVNPHLYQAANKLKKNLPTHFYTLQLQQGNYQIAKKAHTISAFGILEKDAKRVKGGTGWTVQLALDEEVYLFDIPSQTWCRSEHHYYVSDDSACLVAGSKFLPWNLKPTLHQSSAVVGSRDLDEKTQQEIKALFNRAFCLLENIEQLKSGTGRLSFVKKQSWNVSSFVNILKYIIPLCKDR